MFQLKDPYLYADPLLSAPRKYGILVKKHDMHRGCQGSSVEGMIRIKLLKVWNIQEAEDRRIVRFLC